MNNNILIGSSKRRNHLERLRVYEMKILKWLFCVRNCGIKSYLVNMEMNFGIP